MQFTECLYYGHSTPALRTRVRAAALVSNDPGLRFTEERTSQIPGIFRPCVQFRRRPIYGRFAGTQRVPTFSNSKNYCTISDGISQITIYIITVIVCWKIIIVQEDSIKFAEIKLRIGFSILIFRYNFDIISILKRLSDYRQFGQEEFSTASRKSHFFLSLHFAKFLNTVFNLFRAFSAASIEAWRNLEASAMKWASSRGERPGRNSGV